MKPVTLGHSRKLYTSIAQEQSNFINKNATPTAPGYNRGTAGTRLLFPRFQTGRNETNLVNAG